MEQNALCNAVKLIARSYIFFYLNIMIGAWDILPSWLGFFWILSVIPVLAEEIQSTKLLKPLATMLVLYAFVDWIVTALGAEPYLNSIYLWPLLETIMSVVTIYFHFQLLTNMAELAAQYQCTAEKTLLRLRTVCTVINTIIALPIAWQGYELIYMGMVAVDLIAVVWICRKLYGFRRELWSHLQVRQASDISEE